MRENVRGWLRFYGALFIMPVLTVGIQISVNRLYAYHRISALMANVPTLCKSEQNELNRLLLDYTHAPSFGSKLAQPHVSFGAATYYPDERAGPEDLDVSRLSRPRPAAQVLDTQERAAAKRYLRALGRLREILSEMPGGLTEMRP